MFKEEISIYPERPRPWQKARLRISLVSMRREYYAPDRTPVFCQYRYLGPPTQELPPRFRFLP